MMDIDLATCAAGARLVSLLDRLDVTRLDPAQVLAYIAAVRRQQAWTDAQLIRAAARFAEARDAVGPGGNPDEEELVRFGGVGSPRCGKHTPDELAADLRLSRQAAQRLIADALDLMYRLPEVWTVLRLGLVDTWRARMVAEATRGLSAETATAVEQEILGRITRLTRERLHTTIDRLAPPTESRPAVDATESNGCVTWSAG